jgi:transaldolase
MLSDGYKSLLHKMTCISDTDLWNDSCSIEELESAIDQGAVGATANPVIVGEVLRKEMPLWRERIIELINEYPETSEDDLVWKITEEISLKGAKLLLPVFEKGRGKKGRLSIQTNPKNYRNKERMVEQAIHFNNLAPNIIVKLPATKAGVAAIEDATYNGVSINATVCFTVPQCLAVAEAVERGLERRRQDGKDTSTIGAVCTIMVGRLDDWLKVVANKKDIITEPEYLEWAGVAVMKRAYRLFRERGYTTRLLSAATRNHRHWSEFIGGDVVVTVTHQWQKRLNSSNIEVIPRMDKPIDEQIIKALSEKFHDFRRAYLDNGMSVDEFDAYGATRRTLRQFLSGYDELTRIIRELMLPDPDKDK